MSATWFIIPPRISAAPGGCCALAVPGHRHHYDRFRKLLVEAREQVQLTQIPVAQRLGKPQSYVSKYERDERRLDFTEFLELADIFAINLAEFIERYRNNVK